jgi:hypothetical protein
MIMTLVGLLIVLWIIGLLVHIGGGLIHLLLIAAVIIFIWNLITGRRRV